MIEILIAFGRTYWKQLAVALTVAIVFMFGYYKGYSHEHFKYQEHLNEDARLAAIAKAEYKRKVKEAEDVTANVTKEYADAVAKINEYYKSHPHIVRLCGPNQANTLPTKSKGAKGASTAPNRTTEANAPYIEIDLQKAAKEIAQCQSLIKWELEQESIE